MNDRFEPMLAKIANKIVSNVEIFFAFHLLMSIFAVVVIGPNIFNEAKTTESIFLIIISLISVIYSVIFFYVFITEQDKLLKEEDSEKILEEQKIFIRKFIMNRLFSKEYFLFLIISYLGLLFVSITNSFNN